MPKPDTRAVAKNPAEPGRRRWAAFAAAALLLCLGVRATLTARAYAVTTDEFAHLPAGLAVLLHRDFRVDREAPPLAATLQALPALLAAPVFPAAIVADKPEAGPWRAGYLFEQANRRRYTSFYPGPRFMTTLMAVGLAALVAAWARRLWGDGAGLAALALLAFEPNLIAHAGLVTTDVPACLTMMLALHAVERLACRGGAGWTVWAGVALGLAQLTKFTAVVLYPVALVAVLVAARPLRPALARLGLAALLSLAVLNAGYLFHGSFSPATSLKLTSRFGARLGALGAPLPFPADYIRGLDAQARNTEGKFVTWLNGRLYLGEAPWYYDLEVLLLKTPLAEIALVVVALFGLRRAARGEARLSVILCATTAALLFVAASLADLNLGVRYVLLLYPLAALAVASLSPRLPRVLAIGLFLHAAESAARYGHELPFVNLAVGGPEGALRYIAESNIDWGQDLPALAETLRELGVSHVRLAYFGRVDPRLYGIDFEIARARVEPGWYAISANHRVGIPYVLYDVASGEGRWTQPGEFAAFAGMRPRARAGASIYVYHVPD